MSDPIGANIFIASGVTHFWNPTYPSAGWQGNTFFQGQPLSTDAALTSTMGAVRLNPNGAYSHAVSIRNDGPNDTTYNIQWSND
jgi:hypothetical protein